MAFWCDGKGGAVRKLNDEAAAVQRSLASGGVHFSFEKLDKVTRTTVRGRFQAVSEEAHHRSALVSFAVSEEALAEARAATSSGEHHPIEEEDEEEPMQEEASVEANATAVAAAREQARAAMAERAVRRARERERRFA